MAGIISDNLGRSSGLIKAAGGGETNTPYFRAYSNGDQSVSNGADTLVQFGAEDYDSASAYNTTTFKFIPQTAGKYYLHTNLFVTAVNDTEWYVCFIQKNGSFVGRR